MGSQGRQPTVWEWGLGSGRGACPSARCGWGNGLSWAQPSQRIFALLPKTDISTGT